MQRKIIVTAAASFLLIAACGKAADDQAKATSAQTEANEKIIAARAEADRKAVAAQVEADGKIAAAQASFTRRREDYRHKMTLELAALDERIDGLATKLKTASGKTQSDLATHLHEIRVSRESFVTDYGSLEAASATTWDATQARLDKEWATLRALVDAA